MDTKEKRIIIIAVSVVLVVILGLFLWFNNKYSYKPDESKFHLEFIEYYTDRREIYIVNKGVLALVTDMYEGKTDKVQQFPLTEKEIKTFSDYIVRKKRFFLRPDILLNAEEPATLNTEQLNDRPAKYDLKVIFNDLERSVTGYSKKRVLVIEDIRDFIIAMSEEYIAKNN